MSTFGMQQDTNTNWCWFPVSSYSCSIPSLSCTFHLISGSVSRMWFLREAKYDFPGLIHPHVGSCSHTMDTDKCMNQCVSVSGMSVTWIIICELEWCLVKQWAVRHRDKLCTLLSVPSGTTGRVSTILCVCVFVEHVHATNFFTLTNIDLHFHVHRFAQMIFFTVTSC